MDGNNIMRVDDDPPDGFPFWSLNRGGMKLNRE